VRRVGRRFAELAPLSAAHAELEAARADLAAPRSWPPRTRRSPRGGGGRGRLPPLEEKLGEMLIPRDPSDAKDVIIEIKAGEGGQESALFAGDLLRMYTRYAERHGWVVEVIDSQESDLGGVKDISVAVKTKGVPEGGTASGPG
jgi:peptide chain release factor 1